jgi:hypothetical protein
MTVIICTIFDERIGNRVIFDSYESAAEVLEPGTFFEETEETGIVAIGSKWNGTSWVPATDEELAAYYEKNRQIPEPTEEPVVE